MVEFRAVQHHRVVRKVAKVGQCFALLHAPDFVSIADLSVRTAATRALYNVARLQAFGCHNYSISLGSERRTDNADIMYK